MIINTSRITIMKAIATRQASIAICSNFPMTKARSSPSSSCFSSVAFQKKYQQQDQDHENSQFPLLSPSSSSKWNEKINNKTANTTKIRNIQDFIDQIPKAVNRRKIEKIEPGASDDPVAQLFRRSELPTHAWLKYALFDEDKPYTRNLISTDNKTYTLLLLCWNSEKESPIHDHPCDGCWLQVLKGGIREVRYDKQLNCVADLDYIDGELSYITDNIGYHKVCNTGQNKAVTLHLYAPPFETCNIWYDTANPLQPKEGHNINHSEYGVVRAVQDNSMRYGK